MTKKRVKQDLGRVECVLGNHITDRASALQRVMGWEKPRKSGGGNMIVLRSPVDEFACWECIERAKKGIPTWQNSLPF